MIQRSLVGQSRASVSVGTVCSRAVDSASRALTIRHISQSAVCAAQMCCRQSTVDNIFYFVLLFSPDFSAKTQLRQTVNVARCHTKTDIVVCPGLATMMTLSPHSGSPLFHLVLSQACRKPSAVVRFTAVYRRHLTVHCQSFSCLSFL